MCLCWGGLGGRVIFETFSFCYGWYDRYHLIDYVVSDFCSDNSEGGRGRKVCRGSSRVGSTYRYEWVFCPNRWTILCLHGGLQGKGVSCGGKTSDDCSSGFCKRPSWRDLCWSWCYGSCFRSSTCRKTELVHLNQCNVVMPWEREDWEWTENYWSSELSSSSFSSLCMSLGWCEVFLTD